jgi:hypothetical protein
MEREGGRARSRRRCKAIGIGWRLAIFCLLPHEFASRLASPVAQGTGEENDEDGERRPDGIIMPDL